MAYIYREWLKKVHNGQSFGSAIDGWVPAEDRIIIEAGERSGRLPDSLERAVKVQEASSKIKWTILGGIAQPVVLVIMACFLMVIFGVRVIPAFSDAYPRSKWTGLPVFLGEVSDIIIAYMIPFIITCIGIIGVSIWSLPKWTGPLRVKFDRYPPWSIYRLNAGASFMLSVSALVKAGETIPNILNVMMTGATPWFQERMRAALKYVNNGASFGDALYMTKQWFPDEETVRDLRAFAKLDGFDDRLEAIGNDMLKTSVEKIEIQMKILKNAALFLLGGIFATIVLGIFALQQMITDAVSMPGH